MRKILIINTIGFKFEGISNVLVNYISNMNQNGLCFTFLSFETDQPAMREILSKLGTVIIIPPRKKIILYIKVLYKLLKNQYDVLHINGNSGTMFIETSIGTLSHVKKIIVHGHSSSCKHKVLHKILKVLMIKQADECLACSQIVGNWLYGRHPYTILHNAIDLERFAFHPQVRDKVRAEFGLKDEIVIGHIGNFNEQKNHKFLVEVFAYFCKLCPDAKLLLGSDGTLLNNIKKLIKEKGLESKVIFAGRRKDVELLYQAMDCFVFPSYYEGLGLVAVEAQAAGLPVIASMGVPMEAKCTSLFYRIDLNLGAEYWAKEIEKVLYNKKNCCLDYSDEIRNRNLDILEEAQNLRSIYC